MNRNEKLTESVKFVVSATTKQMIRDAVAKSAQPRLTESEWCRQVIEKKLYGSTKRGES